MNGEERPSLVAETSWSSTNAGETQVLTRRQRCKTAPKNYAAHNNDATGLRTPSRMRGGGERREKEMFNFLIFSYFSLPAGGRPIKISRTSPEKLSLISIKRRYPPGTLVIPRHCYALSRER